MPKNTVREIMAKDPVTLGRNDTMDLARDIMSLGRIRHFPVMDGERVVGVVSQRDLYGASFASVMHYGERAQKEFLKTIAVKEVMRHPPITISPDAPIEKAARLMVEKKIGCLPVVDADKLVGLVTETDLLKVLIGP